MSVAETASKEKNSNVNSPQKPERRKWFADVFVIVFCVTGAAFSLNLFRLDLFQSIATQNKKPMGSVTVKYNNVQRRFSDRVLWSRLTVDSPVYLGDLIRVAEYSAATLNINDGIIDINENSLIRIRASQDGEARVVIDLNSGSLSITGSDTSDSTVALNVMGRIIAPTAKATLSVSAKENGITLQVNEGSAIITGEDGQSRSMDAGEALILNNQGVEQATPMAVVTLPRPNARYIKNTVEPLNIRFTWNVINIDPQKPLRLEIAAGPNFTRIVRTAEGIDFSNVALGAGTWHWRLSYQDNVLSSGQFTIVDAVMSAPVSPIKDSLDYRENTPIRFEWQPIEEASYYILEAGLTPDIKNPVITKQTAIASYVESNMEAGTWYWRVKPVFPSLYEGITDFSQVSSFHIEKTDEPVTVAQVADNFEDNSLTIPTKPEPELKSKTNSKTDKSKADKPDKPATPSTANTATPNISESNSNNSATPSASNTATPDSSTLNFVAVISSTAQWKAYSDDSSKSNVSVGREIIDGIEREVLTININMASGIAGTANGNKWAGASTENKDVIQKLRKATGVRFKVLGDGKKWAVNFCTSDVTNYAYHTATISTKKGVVANIDIPFSKLRQPEWTNEWARFNKNNLGLFRVEKNLNDGTGDAGLSTIKIFDFEMY